MKKLLGFFLAGGIIALTSCETTREITLNDNGSGKMVTTTDMSSLVGIAKMSGNETKGMDQAIDTTIALDKMVDSIPELTTGEKALVKKGMLGLKIDMGDEKMITRLEFPFENTAQIKTLDAVSDKVMTQAMKSRSDGKDDGNPFADGQMPKASLDDYYAMTYGSGLIERKHIPEKYAKIGEDEGMQALKEVTEQGMPMTTTLIYNLPRPAKKAEGRNVKLSEDKKKVTITSSTDDFFDDVTKLEFRVEY